MKVRGKRNRSEVVTKSCQSEGHPEIQKYTIKKLLTYLTTYKFKARAKFFINKPGQQIICINVIFLIYKMPLHIRKKK